MLNGFLEKDYVRFAKGGIPWREAIKVAAENFVEKDIIDESYVDEIISCIEEFGPYIVLIPGVAMPHSSQSSNGVKGTGISFTKFDEPIIFDEEDDSKFATLFFTLAAKNEDEHMENISNLSNLLMDEEILEQLFEVNNLEEFKALAIKYENESE